MATDFNKPVVTDAYATLLPGLVTANKDLAMMLEPTLTGTSTNLPTGAVRWNATTVRWERYNGTAWVTLPIDGDNVYAISISGNAATTTALATARTIGGVSFNGTANINLPGVNTAGNQNTSGNAATATKLATARTIGGVSFDGTANINLPGVNITGNQNTSGNAATATLATKASTLSQGGANGEAMTFNWSGQPGQPTWLWGTSDGLSTYVFNPSNFSVNYANTAGNGGVTSVNGQTGAVTVASAPTTDQVASATSGIAALTVGSYALLRSTAGSGVSAGSAYSALSQIGIYSLPNGSVTSVIGAAVPGTWRAMTSAVAVTNSYSVSLFLRIA